MHASAATGRALAALRRCAPDDDHLFPTAILRGHALIGQPSSPDELLASWQAGATRETGSARYRWAINPRFADPLPAWAGPEPTWHPWRPRDVDAIADRPSRLESFVHRLLIPIILADVLELLVDARDRQDPCGERARAYLDEALPKIRRDAAVWVAESHAWSDTWALWAIARRPGALRILHPFALTIADAYAATARQTNSVVLGTRFPFHDVPLISASAQLATGLVALGFHPKLVGAIATRIAREMHDDGGWGDGGGPSDLPTTLVAADLLATLDPRFDPEATAEWFARAQREDGWWRAFGPEATWLTVEILGWLRAIERPFPERFRWPSIALTDRDRRTGLPFYAYYADFERLCTEVTGLAQARIDVAFIDLAGFGRFNNAFGMAMGDRALTSFAQALARVPGSMAIRDGGDEFIVVGPPTGTGLAARLAAFRESWPAEFAATFGDAGVVAPRVLTLTTTGGRLVAARDEMGKRIADLKRDTPTVGWPGVQVDIGPFA
jgi:GGDEF domain-containing protein